MTVIWENEEYSSYSRNIDRIWKSLQILKVYTKLQPQIECQDLICEIYDISGYKRLSAINSCQKTSIFTKTDFLLKNSLRTSF